MLNFEKIFSKKVLKFRKSVYLPLRVVRNFSAKNAKLGKNSMKFNKKSTNFAKNSPQIQKNLKFFTLRCQIFATMSAYQIFTKG